MQDFLLKSRLTRCLILINVASLQAGASRAPKVHCYGSHALVAVTALQTNLLLALHGMKFTLCTELDHVDGTMLVLSSRVRAIGSPCMADRRFYGISTLRVMINAECSKKFNALQLVQISCCPSSSVLALISTGLRQSWRMNVKTKGHFLV